MSNIGYFSEFKGRLFGLTGTLGSHAECRLLNEVFGVTFLRMPRFRRRFCCELDALLATNEDQWLDNISKAVQHQMKTEKRAVLLICDNIDNVQSIEKKLKKDSVSTNVRAYTSSFDKEFQKEQQDKELEPGDVIVATNLAGRGMDLKISKELEKNGGLHVIISYVPANARVEAQAQGRTARAGQPGSYQFAVNCNRITAHEDEQIDAASELQGLKEERDEAEAIRLEKLGTTGLRMIRLEEKLFNRFRQEIYEPVATKLREQKHPEPYRKLQLDFLTNKWALWLDENGHDSDGDNLKDDSNEFDSFREKCLLLVGNSPKSWFNTTISDLATKLTSEKIHPTLIKFASSPSELIKLGRHFSSDDFKNKDAADLCFQRVVEREPKYCENALLHQTHVILQKQGETDKKLEAKRLLLRAKQSMQHKIDLLSSCNENIKLVTQLGYKSPNDPYNKTGFEEQVNTSLHCIISYLMFFSDHM